MKIRIKKKTLEETSGVAGMTGFAGTVPEKVHKKARYIQDNEGKPRDQAYAIAIRPKTDRSDPRTRRRAL